MTQKNILIALSLIILLFVKCKQGTSEGNSEINQDSLVVFYDDNSALAGFKNIKGQILIPAQYEYAGDYENGLALVYKDLKYGFINKQGKEVIRRIYNKALPFRGDKAVVQSDSGWNFIDREGKFLMKLTYDEVETSTDDSLYITKSNGLYGLIDLSGYAVRPPKYADYATLPKFYEGITKFIDKENNTFGFYDIYRNILFPGRYRSVGEFSDGLGAVLIEGKIGFIDKFEKIMIKPIYDPSSFELQYSLPKFYNHYVTIHKEGKSGVIDTKGNVIVPIIYDFCSTTDQNGFTVFKQDGKYGLVNGKGKVTVLSKYDNIEINYNSDSIYRVSLGNLWGCIGASGKVIVPCKYDMVYDFDGAERTFAKKQNKYAVIDRSGKEITSFQFNDIYGGFKEGIAGVKKGARYIFINLKGIQIVPGEFDQVNQFEKGIALVKDKGEEYYINKKGKVVTSLKKKESTLTKEDYKGHPEDYFSLTELQNLCEFNSEKFRKAVALKSYDYIKDYSSEKMDLYELPYIDELPPSLEKQKQTKALIFSCSPKEPVNLIMDSLAGQGYHLTYTKGKFKVYSNEKFSIEFNYYEVSENKFQYTVYIEKLNSKALSKEISKKSDDISYSSSLQRKKFDIPSAKTDTKLYINKGDELSISVSGEIVLGMFAGSGDVNGIDGYSSYSIYPAFRHGSLLFRIGAGDWEAAGDNVIKNARNAGTLQFLVNDNDISNNSGSFHVEVGLKKMK